MQIPKLNFAFFFLRRFACAPPHSYPFNWPTATRYFRLTFAYQRSRVQFRLPSPSASASASSSTLALALSLSVQCVDLKSCDDAAYQWQCSRLISATKYTCPSQSRVRPGQVRPRSLPTIAAEWWRLWERQRERERESTVRALELDSALKNINREHAPLAMPLKTNGRSQWAAAVWAQTCSKRTCCKCAEFEWISGSAAWLETCWFAAVEGAEGGVEREGEASGGESACARWSWQRRRLIRAHLKLKLDRGVQGGGEAVTVAVGEGDGEGDWGERLRLRLI